MLATCWMLTLTAALGQAAPQEAALVKAVPSEADLVVRVRGLDPTRDNLNAMLKAMSPTLADRVAKSLDEQLDRFTKQFGAEAARSPFLVLIRAVAAEDPKQPPFAILIPADDYRGVLKSIAGGRELALREQPGGFDAFDGPEDAAWYAAKGAGFVAFGPDRALIAAVARPGDEGLDARLTADLRDRLFRGELGVYVNVAALRSRYGEQIEAAKQKFLATLDQARPQLGNAASLDQIKAMYGGMFDAVKVVDVLVIGHDFAAEGLDVAGAVAIKPETELARALAEAHPSPTADLDRLPADAAYYLFMDVNPKLFARLQRFGISMMYSGSPPAQLEQAARAHAELGRLTVLSAVRYAPGGMRGFNLVRVADPQKYLANTTALMEGMKPGGPDAPLNFIKDVKVTPNAETYRGFTFSRAEMTMDLEKLARSQPNNPGGVEAMKALMGERIVTWVGTDGRDVRSVTAPTWEEARAQLDAFQDREHPIGATAGFRAVRPKLPEAASVLVLLSAQGLVNQVALQFAAVLNNPALKPPADMPREPALLGAAAIGQPGAIRFQLVVPAAVGPVIEKGLVPLFSGLQGKVNQ